MGYKDSPFWACSNCYESGNVSVDEDDYDGVEFSAYGDAYSRAQSSAYIDDDGYPESNGDWEIDSYSSNDPDEVDTYECNWCGNEVGHYSLVQLVVCEDDGVLYEIDSTCPECGQTYGEDTDSVVASSSSSLPRVGNGVVLGGNGDADLKAITSKYAGGSTVGTPPAIVLNDSVRIEAPTEVEIVVGQ